MIARKESISDARAYDDLLWADTDAQVQSRYVGKSIAVRDKTVIAEGANRREVLEAAAQLGFDREEYVVVEIPPDNMDCAPDVL